MIVYVVVWKLDAISLNKGHLVKTNIASKGMQGVEQVEKKDATDVHSKDRVLILILVIIQKEDGKTIILRRNLTRILRADYQSRFGSLENPLKGFLVWYLENTKDEILLPKNSSVRIDLKTKNRQEVLDSFVFYEGCW